MKKIVLLLFCLFFVNCTEEPDPRGSRITVIQDDLNNVISIRFDYHIESTGAYEDVIYDYFINMHPTDPETRAYLNLTNPQNGIEEMTIFVNDEGEIIGVQTQFASIQAYNRYNNQLANEDFPRQYLDFYRQKLNIDRRIQEILNS